MTPLFSWLKAKNTIVIFSLIIVVLGLSALIYWDEKTTKKEEKDKATKNLVFGFDKDAVQEIVFFDGKIPTEEKTAAEGATATKKKEEHKIKGPTKLTIVKKDEKWRIISPIDAGADDLAVNGLLTAIKDYKYDEIVVDGKNKWKEYGLDPIDRYLIIKFKDKDEIKSKTLYVGAKSPVGYNVYSATDSSEKVFVGSQYLLVSTSKTMNDFRDKTLTTINTDDLRSIAYFMPAKNLRIKISKKDGKYEFVSTPKNMSVDQNAVRDFINDINSAKVEEFNDKPPWALVQAFSPRKLMAEIIWENNNGSTTKLLLSESDKAFWGAFEPKKVVFRLSDDLKQKFAKTIFDFRDRKVFTFDSMNIISAEVDGAFYRRIDNDWYKKEDADKLDTAKKDKKVLKDTEKPKTADHVRSLLVDLEFAKADNFIDLKDPLVRDLPAAPMHKINIMFKPELKIGPMTIEAWVKKEDSNKYYLNYSTGSYLYEVPRAVLANLTEKKSD